MKTFEKIIFPENLEKIVKDVRYSNVKFLERKEKMLSITELRNIEEEAQKQVQDEVQKALAKKANKGKKGGKKSEGRVVSIDRDLVNTFNARVALKGIAKQLRGNIVAATIDINDVKITMVRLPKKNEYDKVRYEVKGGKGKDLITTKQDAIFCLSERTIIETNKAQGIGV